MPFIFHLLLWGPVFVASFGHPDTCIDELAKHALSVNDLGGFVLAPSTAEELGSIMKCATSSAATMSVRSKQKSPDKSSRVTISMDQMNRIERTEENTLLIQAGARFEDIYAFLKGSGKVIVGPQGLNIGAGGYLLGCGIGPLANWAGASCEFLQRVEMVMTNGTLRTVSRELDPDLFWALTGAGQGNFGVATDFEVALLDSPAKMTEGTICFPSDRIEEVINLVATSIYSEKSFLRLDLDKEEGNCLIYSYAGAKGDATAELSPLLELLNNGAGVEVFQREFDDYADFAVNFDKRTLRWNKYDDQYNMGFVVCDVGKDITPALAEYLSTDNAYTQGIRSTLIGHMELTIEEIPLYWNGEARPGLQLITSCTDKGKTQEENNALCRARNTELIEASVCRGNGLVTLLDEAVMMSNEYKFGANAERLMGIKRQHDPDHLLAVGSLKAPRHGEL